MFIPTQNPRSGFSWLGMSLREKSLCKLGWKSERWVFGQWAWSGVLGGWAAVSGSRLIRLVFEWAWFGKITVKSGVKLYLLEGQTQCGHTSRSCQSWDELTGVLLLSGGALGVPGRYYTWRSRGFSLGRILHGHLPSSRQLSDADNCSS